MEVYLAAAKHHWYREKNGESKSHILGTTARRGDAFIEMMEQKRDIEILAKNSVKPYMDSDFGGPFKEGVTVVEHLRALDLEGDSFFLAVPAAQTRHTRIAAGDGLCYSCREYFPINKTGGSFI